MNGITFFMKPPLQCIYQLSQSQFFVSITILYSFSIAKQKKNFLNLSVISFHYGGVLFIKLFFFISLLGFHTSLFFFYICLLHIGWTWMPHDTVGVEKIETGERKWDSGEKTDAHTLDRTILLDLYSRWRVCGVVPHCSRKLSYTTFIVKRQQHFCFYLKSCYLIREHETFRLPADPLSVRILPLQRVFFTIRIKISFRESRNNKTEDMARTKANWKKLGWWKRSVKIPILKRCS